MREFMVTLPDFASIALPTTQDPTHFKLDRCFFHFLNIIFVHSVHLRYYYSLANRPILVI